MPKDQAADLIKEAGKEGGKAVIQKTEKKPSLKIKIKMDLNVQVKLDAHIDGVRNIYSLVYTSRCQSSAHS